MDDPNAAKTELAKEDEVSSDSIEVLDELDGDQKKDSSDESCSSGNMEEIYRNKFLVFSDCEKLVATSEPTSDVDDVSSPPQSHVPIDAVVHVKSDDDQSAPNGGARPKLPKATEDPNSAPSSEDEITPVQQGYDLMHDLDQIADDGVLRPDSLSLPRPLQPKHKQLARSESESSSWSDLYSHHGSTEALIEAASNTPLHTQGTVTKEGDMIAFVAEDLSEKIRMSSPLARKESEGSAKAWRGSRTSSCHSVSSVNSMSSSNSGWSSSSASGWSALSNSGMSRSPSVLTQSPEDIPPIDPRALLELEAQAHCVAINLDHMMANLKFNLHRMSSVTENCVDAYKDGVDNTCDSVDGAIKSMYALMAKCEELSSSFKPVYQLADKIKDIKRLLDLFESQLAKEDKS